MSYLGELTISDLTNEEREECLRIEKLYRDNQNNIEISRNKFLAAFGIDVFLAAGILPILENDAVMAGIVFVCLVGTGYLFSKYSKALKGLPGVEDIPKDIRELDHKIYNRMSDEYGCATHERFIFHEVAECSQEEYESTISVWQKGQRIEIEETIFNTDRIWCPIIDIDKYRTPVKAREDVIYYDYTEFLKQLIVHYMAILKRIPDRNQEAVPPTIYNVSHALCDILYDESENFLESVNEWDYPQKQMLPNQKQEIYEMATNYHEVMESGKCQWWRETYAAAEEMFQEQYGNADLTFIPDFQYSTIERHVNERSLLPEDPYMKKFFHVDMKGFIENEYRIAKLY